MEIRIIHLSGSRAGQAATFDSDTVTFGRGSSNLITFDPEKDILVSGHHAKLIQTIDGWSIEDVGSTNGTWIEGRRIGAITPLQPGTEIELGKGGSRFRVEWGEATSVTPLAGGMGAPPPAEGRTVMMSLDAMASEGAPPPSGVAIPPTARFAAVASPGKKKRSPIFLFLVVILLVVIGGIAMIALTGGSEPEDAQPTKDTASTPPAQPDQAVVEESAEIRHQLASQTAELERLQTMADSSEKPADGEGSEAADLERQLREQQEMIAELTRQLQAKNDDVAAARSAARAAASRRPPAAPTQSSTAPSVAAKTVSAARPAATPTPISTPTVTPAPAPAPPPAVTLINTKFLKRRVTVKGLSSDIPLPGVPDGASAEMAQLVIAALETTGKYVATEAVGSPTASVTLTLTGFHNEEKTRLNTERAVSIAGGIASLAGGSSVPSVSGGAKTVSASADGTLRIRINDASDRQVDDSRVSASAAATKTSVSAASLSMGSAFTTDTPAGDVTRKLVADAVEQIMKQVDRLEWIAHITAQTQEKVLIDCGRECQVENGDVFDVLEGGKAIGRIKVVSIENSSATASLFAGGTSNTLTGKSVHFAGRETASRLYGPTPSVRQLTVRKKTSGYEGPGKSFRKVKDLGVRTRLTFHYAIGYWAKASGGGKTYWLEMTNVDISD